MTNTDDEKSVGSLGQEPREMPLPSDSKAIFLGGLFVLAALGAAYLASEIVLPLVLAFILKLLLQPAVRALEQVVARQPENSDARYLFARGLQKLGRKEDAAREFAEAERLKAQANEREKVRK